MEKQIFDIILEPIITEKSQRDLEKNVYYFKVRKDTNKKDVKEAIEKIFSVKVKKVRIINVKPKKRIRGRIIGEKKGYKKAVVTLKEGKIDLGV